MSPRPDPRTTASNAVWIAAVVLTAVVALLYGPWVHSPKVFDDVTLYSAQGLAHAATVPFDGLPRTFPYFTLALLEVLMPDGLVPNRMVGMTLHAAVALAVFCVALRLFAVLELAESADDRRRASAVAGALALVFAVHPVAVYGAGYLAQRTIVFATLFSLLSVLWLLKALAPDARRGPLVLAALFYAAAVYSKEHAITLAPTVALALLLASWRRGAAGSVPSTPTLVDRPIGRIAAYVALCAPAAILVFQARSAVVGTIYEPFANTALAQLRGIALLELPHGAWMLSALVQSATFFRYVGAWLWPDPTAMSIDLRIDFVKWWTSGAPVVTAVLVALIVVGAIVALVVSRTGSPSRRAAAFGVLMVAGLYVPEFLSVRFQEPYVLYRSYLWGPWILLVPATLLLHVRARTALILATPVAIAVAAGAIDRLASLSSERAVWEDAAAKLPSATLPGAARVYYNRGLARARMQELELARRDFELALQADPNDYEGWFGLGLVAARRDEHQTALLLLDRALSLRADHPDVIMERAGVLERLGRRDDAANAYRPLASQGHVFARMRLEQLLRGRSGPEATASTNAVESSAR